MSYEYIMSLPIIENPSCKFVVYRTLNLQNGMIYIGKHLLRDVDYYGSGNLIVKALRQYGKSNFIRDIIFETDNEQLAYYKEKELITHDLLSSGVLYNMIRGGSGSAMTGKSIYACNDGNSNYRKPLDEILNNDKLFSGYIEIHQPNLRKTVYNNGHDHIYLNDSDNVPNGFVKGRLFHTASNRIWVRNNANDRYFILPSQLKYYESLGYFKGFDTGEISKHANDIRSQQQKSGKFNTHKTNFQPKQHKLSGEAGKLLIDELLSNHVLQLPNSKTNKSFCNNLIKWSPYKLSLTLLEDYTPVIKFTSASNKIRLYELTLEQ